MNDKAKIFYIIGASGSGKDSILKAFGNKNLQSELSTIIAHRYVTRSASIENLTTENFISLSENDFLLRRDKGLFALDWQANGCHYGIGIESTQWLDKGLSVIVNGSRGYLQKAIDKFNAQIFSINVNVDENVLEERLISRKRENNAEIQKRLQRHKELKDQFITDATIDNNGSLDESVNQLINIVNQS